MTHYSCIGISAFHRGFSHGIDEGTEHIIRQREHDSCFHTLFSLAGGLSKTDIKIRPGFSTRNVKGGVCGRGKEPEVSSTATAELELD